MNNKQRLYHSNFNHNGFKKGKANKSRAHNLRAMNTLKKLYSGSVELSEICDQDLIKNNLIFINNKIVDPKNGEAFFKQITEDLDGEKQEYLKQLNNAYDDSGKAKASGKRAKAKAALKRYADGSEDLEKEFWSGLIDKLGSEKIDSEQEIQRLKNTSDTKIKRFNQKISRLEELAKYNDLLGVKSRNTAFTVFSKEVVYKIPDDTDLNVKAIDMANFANKINKQLYPDFRTTYIAVHCDENPERAHAHAELSGKNLKTGEMDIQDQLFINLKKQYERKNKVFPLQNKTYKTLNFEEVQQFGQLYQDHIFEEMNAFLLKNGYDAKLEKRTEQEKKADQRVFLDKKIPSQKREFSRAGKLKAENLKTAKTLEFAKSQIEEKAEELEGLKFEVSTLQKAKKHLLNGFKNAVKFAKDNLPEDLKKYFHNQDLLNDLNRDVAKNLENEAVKIQPTNEQKKQNKIKTVKTKKRPKEVNYL